jgi:4-aminobutyrate--pyruvate transaminase
VICGFGRLGRMFGSEVVGFRPDTVSVAKALSSAYLPIAAVMVPERMYQAMLAESGKVGPFGHGLTYSGHPVAAAVAMKTLEIYARDRIVDKVAAIVPQFQRALRRLGDHPLVGEARGLGLVGGIEMVADRRAKRSFDPRRGVGARCVAFAQAEGLIVRALAGNNTLSLCPPLIISPQQLDELFERLTRALDRTLDWANGQGLLGAVPAG